MQKFVPPVPNISIVLTVIGFVLGILILFLVINLVKSARLYYWRRSVRSGKDLRDQSVYLYAEILKTNRAIRRMVPGKIHGLYDPKKKAIQIQVKHQKDSYIYRSKKMHPWVNVRSLYPEWAVPRSKRTQ